MTNYENAERLRAYFLTHSGQKHIINICTAKKNWNGCDYCDVYAGSGMPCWKQDGKHNCIRCERRQKLV